MKKIFVSGYLFFLNLYSSAFLFAVAVWMTVMICQGFQMNLFIVLLFVYVSEVLLLLALNRTGSVVVLEDGIIKRKGLFFGFYKECAVRSIAKVVEKQYHWRYESYLYLIDSESNSEFRRIRSGSYIGFRKTKRNLAFLRQFWHGKIQ